SLQGCVAPPFLLCAATPHGPIFGASHVGKGLPMAFSRVFSLVSVAIAGAALAAMTVLGMPSFAASVPTEKDNVWAQDYSDIKAEEDIRFGQLPNGMRYALMHNATPVGQVSIRLLVRTGSIGETDAQQGLAHFLEH